MYGHADMTCWSCPADPVVWGHQPCLSPPLSPFRWTESLLSHLPPIGKYLLECVLWAPVEGAVSRWATGCLELMAAMIALPTSTTLFSRHARQTNSKPKIHPMSYVKIILKFAGGGQKVPARHSKQQQNGASLLTASRAHTSTETSLSPATPNN